MEARVGVITVSDSRSAGLNEDLGGPAVEDALRALGYTEISRCLVPDEVGPIQQAIRELAQSCSVVFTTGGTGFSARDVTPEATAPMLDRWANNLAELMRLRGLEQTEFSYLSRGLAGMIGPTLVVNLPGSPKGAVHGVNAIAHLLPPIISSLSGEGCTEH